MTKQQEIEIIAAVTMQFRTFGAGQTSPYNPIVNALKDKPPSFAAGVDVGDVVRFVLKYAEIMEKNNG